MRFFNSFFAFCMENLIRKVILILEDEVKQGYLTDREFDDYISLIRYAAEKIFENMPSS